MVPQHRRRLLQLPLTVPSLPCQKASSSRPGRLQRPHWYQVSSAAVCTILRPKTPSTSTPAQMPQLCLSLSTLIFAGRLSMFSYKEARICSAAESKFSDCLQAPPATSKGRGAVHVRMRDGLAQSHAAWSCAGRRDGPGKDPASARAVLDVAEAGAPGTLMTPF